MFDVFISHSHKDSNVANAMCHKLEESNIRCWIAPRDIPPGATWADEISKAIKLSKFMVIIFSSASNQSKQVLREIEVAISNDVVVLPFRIEDLKPSDGMEYYLSTTHWIDAIDVNLEAKFQQLVSNINGFMNGTKELPPKPLPTKKKSKKVNIMIIIVLLLIIISGTFLYLTLQNQIQEANTVIETSVSYTESPSYDELLSNYEKFENDEYSGEEFTLDLIAFSKKLLIENYNYSEIDLNQLTSEEILLLVINNVDSDLDYLNRETFSSLADKILNLYFRNNPTNNDTTKNDSSDTDFDSNEITNIDNYDLSSEIFIDELNFFEAGKSYTKDDSIIQFDIDRRIVAFYIYNDSFPNSFIEVQTNGELIQKTPMGSDLKGSYYEFTLMDYPQDVSIKIFEDNSYNEYIATIYYHGSFESDTSITSINSATNSDFFYMHPDNEIYVDTTNKILNIQIGMSNNPESKIEVYRDSVNFSVDHYSFGSYYYSLPMKENNEIFNIVVTDLNGNSETYNLHVTNK